VSLQALIFDVDGTLAETEAAHLAAFNETFETQGLDWVWSDALYRKLLSITGGKERIAHYIKNYHVQFDYTGKLEEAISRLHQQKTACYVAKINQGIALRPGVKRLILAARQAGLRLAIATTTSLSNVQALLTYSLDKDALSWFEVIAAGDMVTRKKPASDVYDYALEALDLPPHACLALEDSANGLRSAMGAGIKTIITISDYSRDDDFSGASLLINTLGEGEAHADVHVFSGDLGESSYVDINLLKQLNNT